MSISSRNPHTNDREKSKNDRSTATRRRWSVAHVDHSTMKRSIQFNSDAMRDIHMESMLRHIHKEEGTSKWTQTERQVDRLQEKYQELVSTHNAVKRHCSKTRLLLREQNQQIHDLKRRNLELVHLQMENEQMMMDPVPQQRLQLLLDEIATMQRHKEREKKDFASKLDQCRAMYEETDITKTNIIEEQRTLNELLGNELREQNERFEETQSTNEITKNDLEKARNQIAALKLEIESKDKLIERTAQSIQYQRDTIMAAMVDTQSASAAVSHSMKQRNSDTILKSLQTIDGQLGALKQQVQRNDKIINRHVSFQKTSALKIQVESLREELASDDLGFPSKDGLKEPQPDASQSRLSTKTEDHSKKILNQYCKRCSKVLPFSKLQLSVRSKPTKAICVGKSKFMASQFVERNVFS